MTHITQSRGCKISHCLAFALSASSQSGSQSLAWGSSLTWGSSLVLGSVAQYGHSDDLGLVCLLLSSDGASVTLKGFFALPAALALPTLLMRSWSSDTLVLFLLMRVPCPWVQEDFQCGPVPGPESRQPLAEPSHAALGWSRRH